MKSYSARTTKGVWIFIKGHSYFVSHEKKQHMSAEQMTTQVSDGTVTSPMPGKVFKILVQNGDAVKVGQDLVVIEAMKMEHTLVAPHDGVVSECKISVGDLVDLGQVLLTITKAE